ncbi:MAG: hypothetical protein JXB26_07895 [Candidatus Aminicenantes bacterium]|nr:hypothetical protein [Candidatus Aminicenantes bacterium]
MERKTERIYFENAYKVKFEAEVIESLTYENRPAVVLDKTCFYPESGGQPADHGTLDETEVVDVQEEQGRIIHILEGKVPSGKVRGLINWQRRFDHMQQHSGQHILSQCFARLYNAKTLSFHLGAEYSTLEIEKSGLTDEEWKKVEECANAALFSDRKVATRFVQEEDISKVPLRKPPQKKGVIRVVEVEDFDYTACGGTHVRRTGEIGLIKITKWDRIRGHVRLEFLCGGRALHDYDKKNEVLRNLTKKFTVAEADVPDAVEKLTAELKTWKKENISLRKNLARCEAEDLLKQAEKGILKKVFTGKAREDLRSLALNIIHEGEYVVLFGNRSGEEVHVVLACSESLPYDMREFVSDVMEAVEGKGGGRPSLVEITGTKGDNLETVLDGLYSKLI